MSKLVHLLLSDILQDFKSGCLSRQPILPKSNICGVCVELVRVECVLVRSSLSIRVG